jgi:hypothetical protein
MVALPRYFACGITAQIRKLDAQAQKKARYCEIVKGVRRDEW